MKLQKIKNKLRDIERKKNMYERFPMTMKSEAILGYFFSQKESRDRPY